MKTFAATATAFRRHHSNSLNVALHLVTTPVAMASAMAMLETAGRTRERREARFGRTRRRSRRRTRSAGVRAATTVAWAMIALRGGRDVRERDDDGGDDGGVRGGVRRGRRRRTRRRGRRRIRRRT